MDAALLQVYEGRWRAEDRRDARWIEHQEGKVDRAARLRRGPSLDRRADLHVGHVALACALGYLDLRFEGRWRESYPKLVAWLDDFASRVPAFEKTRVKS